MEKNNIINAYLMRVNKKGEKYQGYMFEVENITEYAKRFVVGDIEIVALSDDIVIICRQDAVIFGCPLNRAMYNESGDLITVFSGNIMAVRQNEGIFSGIFCSDIEVIERCLKPITRIYDGIVFTESASGLPQWDINECKVD